MDLLELLHSGDLTLTEAEAVLEKQVQDFHAGVEKLPWNEYFRMSIYEASAYLHGAGLADLVKLRYEGWPVCCYVCGQSLDYRQGGWSFLRREDGTPQLRHVPCPQMRTQN